MLGADVAGVVLLAPLQLLDPLVTSGCDWFLAYSTGPPGADGVEVLAVGAAGVGLLVLVQLPPALTSG